MNIEEEIDNCESCRDIDKVIRKVKNNRDTAKTVVSGTFTLTRLISNTLLIKKTSQEALKAYTTWNKYDTPEEKFAKVTPPVTYGVITVVSDTVQKTVCSALKRAITDSADDKLYELDKAKKRITRREEREWLKDDERKQ